MRVALQPQNFLAMQDSDLNDWFSSEVQPHESKLRSYLRRKFPTLVDEDDIVQESYARLIRSKKKGEVANSKALLFRIARNAVIDLFRRRRVAKTDTVADFTNLSVLDDGTAITDEISKKEDLQMLTAALLELPDRCRQTMTLRLVYQMSHKEIARELGISPHTVKAQLVKGTKRCVEFFEARK